MTEFILSKVGEFVLSKLLESLCDRLNVSNIVGWIGGEVKGLDADLDKWRQKLQDIQKMHDVAEEKQYSDPDVKQWLDDLKHLVYDVDDIVDELATDAFLAENQARPTKVRKLNIPGASSTRKIDSTLQSKIKEVTDRFNEIVTRKDQLKLKETADGRSHSKAGVSAPTSVLTEPESHVCGREKDKVAVVELLVGEKYCSDAHVSVIPILGMGGIGKTTLAQLVYNDEAIQKSFDLKAWACVSQDFDIDRVTKTILQPLIPSDNCDGKDRNWLQVKLKEKLQGKKFLVVLDDLWNEKYHEWTILRAPFLVGAPGSTIIITTRNQEVSSTASTVPAYDLQVLPRDACLSLFTQHALGANDFSAHPTLRDIGEEIVNRCNGLPLAAKALGGLLRTKHDRDEWKDVLESKIWNIPEEKNEILPALMLCYHHLPSHLKRCFVYCSIFPKDYKFEKEELVRLWMTESLIQTREGDKQMEDLGSKYFHNLLSRSFFQQSRMKTSRFVMHDLINDLAQCVAGDTCFQMEDRIGGSSGGRLPKKVRHSSYLGGQYDSIGMFEAFVELTCLRTFLPLMLRERGNSFLTHNVPLQLLPKLLCLRVLSLSGYCIVELPDSIDDLKHLRYLDLSFTQIKGLPESTTTLRNLQTLILEKCQYLNELPSKLGNLVNLRHLNILNANKLEGMPLEVGKLTSLKTLTNVIVGKDNCFTLKELDSLLHLRGTLIISRVENVIESKDVWDAMLIEKLDLSTLCLEWSVNVDESKDRTSELDVLNMLLPHKTLKELTIKHYGGIEFPTWLKCPSFPNMVLLRIENCRKCTSLPTVGQLPLLKDLFIEGMATVKNVGHEFYGDGCSQTFRSLETLCFKDMEEWENWSPNGEFPHLRDLSIKNCPKLLGTLPNHFPSLQNVVIKRCEQLIVSISSFPELCKLKIEGSEGVVCKSKVDFTTLKSKSFSTISKFRCSVVEGFMKVEVLNIKDCEELTPLWSNDVGLLQPLPRLREIVVRKCQKLVSLVAEEVKEQSQQQGTSSTRNGMEYLPKAVVYNNTCLERIDIWGCDSLTHIVVGQLPPTLKTLRIGNCKKMQILLDGDDTINCSSSNSLLEELNIRSCRSLKSLTSSGELPATLQSLHVSRCNMLESVAKSFPHNSSLETIYILGCENLKSLPMGIYNLRVLLIYDCEKMQALPNCIHNITSLQTLIIEKCP